MDVCSGPPFYTSGAEPPPHPKPPAYASNVYGYNLASVAKKVLRHVFDCQFLHRGYSYTEFSHSLL